MKLLVSLCDAGTVIPVAWLAHAGGASRTEASRAAFAYAMNPVAVLVASFHGQNDPIVVGLLLWAAWLVVALPFPLAAELAALVVSVSLTIKPIGLLFLPLFAAHVPKWGRRSIWCLLAILPCAIAWLPYAVDSPQVLIEVLKSYRGPPDFGYLGIYNSWENLGHGGPGAPVLYALPDAVRIATLLIYALLYVGIGWRLRRAGLVQQMIAAVLVLYVVYGALGAQYLVWVFPFAAARRSRPFWRTALPAAVALIAFYQLHHPGILSGTPGVRIPMGITVPQWSGLFLFAQVLLYAEWVKWIAAILREADENSALRIPNSALSFTPCAETPSHPPDPGA